MKEASGICIPAATSDIIIVCHVNVKHQLLLQGLEGSRLHRVMLTGLSIIEPEKL